MKISITKAGAIKLLLMLLVSACKGNLTQTGVVPLPGVMLLLNERENVKSRIRENLHVITSEDKKRVYDCLDDKRSPRPQPFRRFSRIHYFNSTELEIEKNGFLKVNDWPMLVSLHNYQNYSGNDSRVFITFRGMEWGVHKTPMSYYLTSILKPKLNHDVLLMPDSYLFVNSKKRDITTDKVMTVCHSRNYSEKRHVGMLWPGFKENGSWELVDRFFPENKNIFLIGWSAGSHPRSQFIETKKVNDEKVNFYNIRNQKDFLADYNKNFEFLSDDYQRIAGIVDIETNYSIEKPFWNLAKWLEEVVKKDKSILYFGTCSLTMPNVKNYVKLIQLFDLHGQERKNGVIRYQNPAGNIVIDILSRNRAPYYRYRNVNLRRDTSFEKSRHVRRRISRNHNQMVGYSLRVMNKLLSDMQSDKVREI